MILRALCGFIQLNEGKITIHGKEVKFNQELPVEIGLILETPGFVKNQTAMQNLNFLLSLKNHTSE